jgi:hypothetical protein
MTSIRRFLVLSALMFWQGGFTFYSAVVVPVGKDVLGSHRDQGFITQRVTNYLNLAGAIALLPLAWDASVAGSRSYWWRLVRWARWFSWGGMAMALVVLFWLHLRLDALLDPEAFQILDRKAFRVAHQSYLIISTFQWGCAILYAALVISAWRNDDRTEQSDLHI